MDLATSPLMLMMQHEVIGFVERILRGIEFDDETLGLDVIKEVGPGGNYFAHEHTAAHFRNELWFPELLDRNYWEAWLQGTDKDMMARCRLMKERLLAEHEPEPLADDTLREVDKLLAEAAAVVGR